jgi:hypothetical protein
MSAYQNPDAESGHSAFHPGRRSEWRRMSTQPSRLGGARCYPKAVTGLFNKSRILSDLAIRPFATLSRVPPFQSSWGWFMDDCDRYASRTHTAAETSSIPRSPYAEVSSASVIITEIGRTAENGFKAGRLFHPSATKNRDYNVERCNACYRLASREARGPKNVNKSGFGHQKRFASSRQFGKKVIKCTEVEIFGTAAPSNLPKGDCHVSGVRETRYLTDA